MTKSRYRSYPGGSSLGGGIPAHQASVFAVDADWVAANGSRAQRRRIEKAMRRQTAMTQAERTNSAATKR